jgi:replicative DNA helicase
MSKANIDNFNSKLRELRGKLFDYLLEHGIDATHGKKILCLNPDHDDKHPSMSAFDTSDGTPALHCFSCGWSADVFMAAHALENKPVVGPGFIQDNVRYLAEKYEVEVPLKTLTEEDLYEMNTYQAYQAAAEYITNSNFLAHHIEELTNRGWSADFISKFNVGCCPSYADFRNHMKSYGFAGKFLDDIDLGNEKIFNPNNLIFTVHDEYGKPVGFAARNLKFDGVRDSEGNLLNGSKFNNTKTTNIKCNIYRKSERLYLLHKARKHSPPLFIFEGYGDALTAQGAGLENACAIGALELSEHHLNTCRKNGCYDVVICLDSDDAGQEKARRLLDDILKNVHDIRIRFIFLPDKEIELEDGTIGYEKVDPDIFIRENGAESFLELPKIEPFVWRLQEFEKEGDVDAEAICSLMIPIILMEPNSIKREKMIRELSAYTDYSEKVIREELDRLKSSDQAKIQEAKSAIIDNLMASLKSKKDSPALLLQRAQDDLYSVDKEHNAGELEIDNLVSEALAIKEYTENKELHTGLKMGEFFKTMEVALAGDLRGKFIITGGTGNTGKTSMYANLMWYLPQFNDDIITIMFTIDDSKKEFVPRMMTLDMAQRAYDNGNMDLFELIEINKVAQPFLYEDNPEYPALEQERNISWRKYVELVSSGRMIIRDAEDGKTIDYINTVIKDTANKNPDKRIIAFVDNFHLIELPGYEDGRVKYKNLSHNLKGMCTKYDATICATAEYTKIAPGIKPSNNNLAETVALEYDGNVIFHLYSDLHSVREKSNKFFWSEDGEKQYGIIEQDFGKNKVNSFKGTVYYKFWSDKAFYKEISRQEAMDIEKANAESRSGVSDDDDGPLNTFGENEVPDYGNNKFSTTI